jgi:hypothetical protein
MKQGTHGQGSGKSNFTNTIKRKTRKGLEVFEPWIITEGATGGLTGNGRTEKGHLTKLT